jgi:hypothetical protein
MADIKTEVKDVRDKLAQLPTQREIDARFDALNRRVEALESRR